MALLRLDWFSEHRAAKEMAVETAVRKTEAEWKLRLTRELEEKTDAQIQEGNNDDDDDNNNNNNDDDDNNNMTNNNNKNNDNK